MSRIVDLTYLGFMPSLPRFHLFPDTFLPLKAEWNLSAITGYMSAIIATQRGETTLLSSFMNPIRGRHYRLTLTSRTLYFFPPSAWSKMVARCPSGWLSRGGTDQCYLIHSYGTDRTFKDAMGYCQAHSGDLAIIGNQDLKVSSSAVFLVPNLYGNNRNQNIFFWFSITNSGKIRISVFTSTQYAKFLHNLCC